MVVCTVLPDEIVDSCVIFCSVMDVGSIVRRRRSGFGRFRRLASRTERRYGGRILAAEALHPTSQFTATFPGESEDRKISWAESMGLVLPLCITS